MSQVILVSTPIWTNVYLLYWYSSVQKHKRKRGRVGREARQHNMIQSVSLQIVSSHSTGAWKHVPDMCASQVTAQSGRYSREKSSLTSTNKLIPISENQRAQEPVCSGRPGVLDPLVSALSDLQIALSHLIMVQALWIFKEWLSDTCQTSLTRLMESTISEMVDWPGLPCGLSHKLDFFFYYCCPLKCFLVHHVVLANRM